MALTKTPSVSGARSFRSLSQREKRPQDSSTDRSGSVAESSTLLLGVSVAYRPIHLGQHVCEPGEQTRILERVGSWREVWVMVRMQERQIERRRRRFVETGKVRAWIIINL